MKFVFIVLGLRIEMIWIVIFDEIIYWFWIEEKKKKKRKREKFFFILMRRNLIRILVLLWLFIKWGFVRSFWDLGY